MLTAEQRRDFAQALALTCSIRIFDGTDGYGDEITPSTDSLEEFFVRRGPPNEVLTADNSVILHVWRAPRTQANRALSDLYVADFGAARATFQF